MGGWGNQLVGKAARAYSVRNRQRKADRILALLDRENVKDVLLVGAVSGSNPGGRHGLVEKRIAAAYEIKMGINVIPAVNVDYPFVIADVRDLPFENDYVDFSLANAIIEHVGKEPEQRQMVEEMTRVSRCWVITTPNKWFPVESHTHTLFAHWVPSWRRKHEDIFTRLLSLREFKALLPSGAEVYGRPWSPTFTATYRKPMP